MPIKLILNLSCISRPSDTDIIPTVISKPKRKKKEKKVLPDFYTSGSLIFSPREPFYCNHTLQSFGMPAGLPAF